MARFAKFAKFKSLKMPYTVCHLNLIAVDKLWPVTNNNTCKCYCYYHARATVAMTLHSSILHLSYVTWTSVIVCITILVSSLRKRFRFRVSLSYSVFVTVCRLIIFVVAGPWKLRWEPYTLCATIAGKWEVRLNQDVLTIVPKSC